MKYTMACPVAGCTHVVEVEAQDDNQAVDMLMAATMTHFTEAGHPKDPAMTPEMMKEMTKKEMKKM